MTKGAAIRLKSYEETIPRFLEILGLSKELKKYDKVVLKLSLNKYHDKELTEEKVSPKFIEEVVKFCVNNKNPITEIFIVEGADGKDTIKLFEELGITKIAEKYNVSLIDLNESETENVFSPKFSKFQEIAYPKILKDSFVITLPKLTENSEIDMSGAISSMIGAYPAKVYKGWFSKEKKKIRKWPIKFAIHDIIQCKMPDFAIVDASEKGVLIAGMPLEVDKQAARILGFNWEEIDYLKLIFKTIELEKEMERSRERAKLTDLKLDRMAQSSN